MTYTIKSGHHGASGLHCKLNRDRTMIKIVQMTRSTFYVPRNDDDLDISKITGFSGFLPGRTSVRLGWRCTGNTDEGCVELWAYYHIRGQHIECLLGQIRCGDVVTAILRDYGKRYAVRVENAATGEVFSHTIDKPWTFPWGWTHYPWFGGDNTAPRDMVIKVW